MNRMFAAAKGESGGDLLLYLYDEIGESFWSAGVTAKGIAAELAKAGKIDSITLRINSPGGDVFEGIAIMNLIRTQAVPVTVMVDGLAASAASIVAMTGDKIIMADNAMMMIHDPWIMASGNAADMRKTADLLDKVAGTLASTYAKRTGKPEDEIAAMMAEETWFGAAEAVENGFATEAYTRDQDESAKALALAASFNVKGRFARAPEALTPPPAAAEPEPAPAPAAEPVSHWARDLELRRLELAAVA